MEILIKQEQPGEIAGLYCNGELCQCILHEGLLDPEFMGYLIKMIISQNNPLNELRLSEIERYLKLFIGFKQVNDDVFVETKISKEKGDTLKISCLSTYKGQASGGFIHENDTNHILSNIDKIIEKINAVYSCNTNSYLDNNNTTKPPSGLSPKKFHEKRIKTERFNEVCGAIARYYDAKMKINIEWIEEYNELVEYFKKLK